VSRALRCFIAFGVAWSLQAGVSFAEADWLDRASGFGPDKGFFVHYRFLCVSNPGSVHFTWLKPWDRTASILNAPVGAINHANDSLRSFDTQVDTDAKRAEKACKTDMGVRGYFELVYRRAVSLENDLLANHAQVHLSSYELSYVERFSRMFDVSLSAGLNNIDPRSRDWFALTKLDVAPGDSWVPFQRVAVTPSLIWSPLAGAGDHPYAHLIRVQSGVTVFLRGFHAQDFCNTGVTACLDPTWQTHGADVIPMIRFMVDPSQLWKGW
jgi:hypothetical protein